MVRAWALIAAFAAALLGSAAEAAYPERVVTVVVPFPPGGLTDVLARVTAERLAKTLDRPFIIENRPGAAGLLAADHVKKAAPDGYTLLFTPIFQLTIAPYLNAGLGINPEKDFRPIGASGTTPMVITVGGSIPADTLADFIAYARARLGKLTYASAGAGSLSHFASALVLRQAGLDVVHVPYKGLAQAFSDVLAGHVAMITASPVEIMPHLQTKKVRALAVTGATRSQFLPDVPTVADTLKGIAPVVTHNGLLAPAGTPQTVVDTISKALLAAAEDSDFRERVTKTGLEPIRNTPEEFARMISDGTRNWADVVKDLKLTQN